MTLILSGTDGLSDIDGSAATPAIRGTDANTGIFFPAADTAAIATGGTERVRVDSSGNVGIGTSSLSALLTINSETNTTAYNGSATDGQLTAGATQLIRAAAGANTNVAQLVFQSRALQPFNRIVSSGGTAPFMAFATNNAERARIDSSGNVGIGNTAANVNDQVGAVRPLLVSKSDTSTTIAGSQANIVIGNADTTTNNTSQLSFAAITGGSSTYFTSAAINCVFGARTNGQYPTGQLTFSTSTSLNSAPTEKMRIDSSGNVGIGTSSPSGANGRILEVNGGSGQARFVLKNDTTGSTGNDGSQIALVGAQLIIQNREASDITFETNNNERARITSGGFFKASDAGTYIGSTGAYHELVSSTGSATAAVYIRNTNATSPAGIDLSYSAASPNGTGNTFLYCQDSTALRMSIRSNGGIANYSANNVNLSDRREKTNFAPAGEYLSKICAIPVQTFNYIDQSEDDPGLTLGVVAQDVQAVAPELVMESNWGTEDNPKMRLSIYQTDMQYALMKCIQELKAINDAQAQTIQSLTARIEALEGK